MKSSQHKSENLSTASSVSSGTSKVARVMMDNRPQIAVQRQLQKQIASKSDAVLQRLVYIKKSETNYPTLYVPDSWANQVVTFEGKSQSIRNHLNSKKSTFVKAIGNAINIELKHIVVTNDVKKLSIGGIKANKKRQAESKLKKILLSETSIAKLPDIEVNPAEIVENLIFKAQDLVPEPDDLQEDIEMAKVCSLISLIKSEGIENIKKWLENQDDRFSKLKSDRKVILQKLHEYYYTNKGVMYDDQSSHIKLFSDWDYQLIKTGDFSWHDLLGLNDILSVGGKYIFDTEGHTVYVELKKALPAQVTSNMSMNEYFAIHNDGDNFNTDQYAKRVKYIFKKK